MNTQELNECRAAFEADTNAARFFPREINFSRAPSPSGRDEYVTSHLQSRWEGFQAAWSRAPAPPESEHDGFMCKEIAQRFADLVEENARLIAAKPAYDATKWKLVPVVPTERMICAGIEAYQGKCEESYAAMIAAAPAAPAAEPAPADPMDWKLPCDVKVGAGTIKAGCALRTLVARMHIMHDMIREGWSSSAPSTAADPAQERPTKELLKEAISDRVATAETLMQDILPARASERYYEAKKVLDELVDHLYAAAPSPAHEGSEATRLDVMSLIRSQMHRVYASAIDREDVDTAHMGEIESAITAIYHGRYVAGYDLRKKEDAALSAQAQPSVRDAPGITAEAQAVLAEVFSDSERPDKITVSVEPGNNVVIRYDDMDEEWCNELCAALKSSNPEGQQ